MKHIFLTGQIQSGKTTIIEQILKKYTLKYDGFQTFFDTRNPMYKVLCLERKQNLGYEKSQRKVVRVKNGVPEISTESMMHLVNIFWLILVTGQIAMLWMSVGDLKKRQIAFEIR